jgi:hypothetical protein
MVGRIVILPPNFSVCSLLRTLLSGWVAVGAAAEGGGEDTSEATGEVDERMFDEGVGEEEAVEEAGELKLEPPPGLLLFFGENCCTVTLRASIDA